MIINRILSIKFLEMMKKYPIVTVVGPRQSGKTTLVKTHCKDYGYINLEDPETRTMAAQDPHALLNRYPDGLIIDEVQQVPSLLSYLQVIVDEKKQDGLYVLTGSHQPALHQALSQSLAGRTAILKLLPLSILELEKEKISLTTNEAMLNGFYPRIYEKQLNPAEIYRDYIQTYLERDIRQLINVKDLMTFQRFIKLCAARTGTILNMHGLGNDVGVDSHTVKHWLSVLQATYLIELVPAYFENIGKRLIKSPKLYFTDVGLVSYLLGIETLSQIDRDPLRGQLFETMVAIELMKARFNQGRDPRLYFYRDSQQYEIDLIYQMGSELIPIEIKSAQTFSPDFIKNIEYFCKLKKCKKSYVIYNGNQNMTFKNTTLINYKDSYRIIE
ncbi:MAG: AAA family ATPase [Gammaproteobacteria bacterium RIFCSPHIGHO2_02_FULL_39_13]|nr:MAG: AAA family ATPase [Gammaproteobacteria bacterium RIFCSPHIGHO2_02_FULL_39_13]OGT49790.1 MAG: AAA family ATPase [Gammaproteobacteria bacterium RIFCSPHIGHO2_12_FULL_39_24]